MTPTAKSPTDLQDAFDELLTLGEQPSAEILDQVVARYPEHAAALTDFAIEWLAQDLLPPGEDEELAAADDASSESVQRAMQRFRERLGQVDAAGGQLVDPFDGRTSEDLAKIGVDLDLDKSLMAKLRDRKIDGATVPPQLVERLALALVVSAAAVTAHLNAQARLHHQQDFKMVQQDKPEAGAKESFADAVRNSSLDDESKERWLAMNG